MLSYVIIICYHGCHISYFLSDWFILEAERHIADIMIRNIYDLLWTCRIIEFHWMIYITFLTCKWSLHTYNTTLSVTGEQQTKKLWAVKKWRQGSFGSKYEMSLAKRFDFAAHNYLFMSRHTFRQFSQFLIVSTRSGFRIVLI